MSYSSESPTEKYQITKSYRNLKQNFGLTPGRIKSIFGRSLRVLNGVPLSDLVDREVREFLNYSCHSGVAGLTLKIHKTTEADYVFG